MLEDLQALEQEALAAVAAAADGAALDAAQSEYVGKKGRLSGLLRTVGQLPAEERGPFGKAANLARKATSTDPASFTYRP